MSKTICLDFDGVMNTYTGWKGEDFLFEPREGLEEFLIHLKAENWKIVVHSTRDVGKLRQWLCNHELNVFIDEICFRKPIATCYVDDRAITFKGDYEAVQNIIDSGFKAYWEPRC